MAKKFTHEFKFLISKGKTEEAILLLLDNKTVFDNDQQKQIELISGQYYQLRDNFFIGLSQESDNIEKRRIEYALLELVSGLKDAELMPTNEGVDSYKTNKIKPLKIRRSVKYFILGMFFLLITFIVAFIISSDFTEENLSITNQQFSDSKEFVFTLSNKGAKELTLNKVKIKKISNFPGVVTRKLSNSSKAPYTLVVDNLKINEEAFIDLNNFILPKNDKRILEISTKTQKNCEFEITFYYSNNRKTYTTKIKTI